MTLRDDLIEALCAHQWKRLGVPQHPPLCAHEEAISDIDAILTTLADHPDEWCESSDDTKMLDRAIPVELIEALRA